MSLELSVVSGTYNRLAYLQKMVWSVRQSLTADIPYEIVLVDGGSTDGTQDWARNEPDVVLIEQGELLGAIAAYAAGFAVAQGKYVIIANDDLVFTGDSVLRALKQQYDNPGGIVGTFYTDRFGGAQVAYMPALDKDGHPTSVHYGGLVCVPRWLGDGLEWWTCPGARTYGGDNAMCARAWEAGFQVVPIPGTLVHETIPHDELNAINNNRPEETHNHPDTEAYLRLFPHGPHLGLSRKLVGPTLERPYRILYAPIYEKGHVRQHEQKRGLRRALQRIGLVWEVDYAEHGPEAILRAAEKWQPDLVLTQCHYGEPFTAGHAYSLRQMLPRGARMVNWNGDVWFAEDKAEIREPYYALLRNYDLHTVVNARLIPIFERAGIPTMYWQIGYEPDGVGFEPDERTPRHDVLFLGNGYSAERLAFGAALVKYGIESGYDVGIYGAWSTAGIARGENLYDFKVGCQLYRNARISISDGQYPQDIGFVSNRLFQALAAGGSLLLQQRFNGIDTLIGFRDNEHLILWDDYPDLLKKLDYWLSPRREARRSQIARNGQRECLKKHSFEKRVVDLMARVNQSGPLWDDPTLAIFQGGFHA